MKHFYGRHLPIPLDLHDRALLGLHFLTHSLDEGYGYLPNILMRFDKEYPLARHDFADFGDLTSRYMEAIYLTRVMTGSRAGDDVLKALERLFLSFFNHRDGLSYRPVIDQPFYSEAARVPYRGDLAEGFDQSRVMVALATWFMMTGESKPKKLFEELVAGFRAKAIQRDNFMYFTQAFFPPGFHPSPDDPPYPQQLYFAGTQIGPLIKGYELTGHEPALDTARRLVNFFTRDTFYFGPEGSFESLEVVPPGSWDRINGHTHTRLGAIAGMLKYANVVNDQKVLEFGKRAFDWFYRGYCLSTGWCPEFLGRYPLEQEGCETCTLMDLAAGAIELGKAGFDEYWGIVERITRNQLAEQQVTDTSFMGRKGDLSRREFQEYPIDPDTVLGAFGGWCGVNDFVGNNIYSRCLMHCCGPSGIKALYLAWHSALIFEKGKLHINLLLSRRSKIADIRSYDPWEGRVDVTIHQSCELDLRLPDWVEKDQVRLGINGHSVDCRWRGTRLLVGPVDAAVEVRVTYPLRTISVTEKTGTLEFKTRWVGDTVVSISPPGKKVPLYQRKDLIQKAGMIKLPDHFPEIEPDL